MATETKSTTVRLKPTAQDGSSKPKIDSLALKKKIDGSSRPPTDSKMKSVTTVTKSEVKLKATPSSSSKPAPLPSSKPAPSLSSKPITSSSLKPTPSSSSSKTITKTTTTTKVREKKVYSLPGQKHDPPEQKEPLRIFYESLSKQIPTSEMAEFWLMEHGLLSPERAKRAFEKKQRKQKELRTGTPVKPSKPPPSKPETSRKQQQPSRNGDIKAKKRIVDDSDDDDDFVLSHKRWKSS